MNKNLDLCEGCERKSTLQKRIKENVRCQMCCLAKECGVLLNTGQITQLINFKKTNFPPDAEFNADDIKEIIQKQGQLPLAYFDDRKYQLRKVLSLKS
jgi:hypothetical protein